MTPAKHTFLMILCIHSQTFDAVGGRRQEEGQPEGAHQICLIEQHKEAPASSKASQGSIGRQGYWSKTSRCAGDDRVKGSGTA